MNTLIISEDLRRISDVGKALTALDSNSHVQSYEGRLNGHTALPAKGETDLLVLDCTKDPEGQFQQLERLTPLYPRMKTVLVLEEKSPELLMRAMRLGVSEILTPPVQREDVHAAIHRIERRFHSVEHSQGKVAAFISCKGGSGATFLATNVAYALAANEGRRVLLVDLNLQFGDAALFISDRRPPATLSEIARDIERLDDSLIDSAMIKVLPDFGVIAAPDDPAHSSEIRPAQVEALVRFARARFDHVILDIGRSLDAVSIQALDMADEIYPIFQLTLPFIRDGKRLMSLFSSLNYPREKIRPIVNRFERKNDLSIDDLERAISSKVFATIPNHYETVAASVNQGIPLLKMYRSSPVARSLGVLAKGMIVEPESRSRSWLGRLFAKSSN